MKKTVANKKRATKYAAQFMKTENNKSRTQRRIAKRHALAVARRQKKAK